MFTDTQQFRIHDNESRVLTVKANGGTVQVQAQAGASWITADTYTADTAVEVFFGGALVRVVPSGGAEYDVQ